MEGEVCDDSDALAKLGERHHRPSDTTGITFRLTSSEYAANFRQAPQHPDTC